MKYSEFVLQKALGTLDYREVATSTKSVKVLEDIANSTQDTSVQLCIVMNPCTTLSILSSIVAVNSNVEEEVIVACAWHPQVTLDVLQKWLTHDHISRLSGVRAKVRALQLVSRILESDAITLNAPKRYFIVEKDKNGSKKQNYYYPMPPEPPEGVVWESITTTT